GDARGRHREKRFPGAGAPAAAVITPTILRVKREVSVARTIFFLNLGIILRALILISKQNTDRGAIGHAFKDAGPDFRYIGLVALRNDDGLAGPATTEIGKKIVHGQRQTGRAAVDDGQVARSVTNAGR